MSILKTIDSMFCYITPDNIMGECPNCDKKIIRSYPTTTCTYCQTVFQNKIEPIRKHITYKAVYPSQPNGPVFYNSETTICGMVRSMLREQAELSKKMKEPTPEEYAASLIYSADVIK